MSVDGEKIADGAFQLHNMLAAPLHIIGKRAGYDVI